MERIAENEIFSEKIGTEAGARWSDVLYKGKNVSNFPIFGKFIFY